MGVGSRIGQGFGMEVQLDGTGIGDGTGIWDGTGVEVLLVN